MSRTIPFKIEDAHYGFSEVKGLLYVEEEFLVFEFRVKKLWLFEQPPERVKAEHGLIDHISLKKGWFNDKVCIVPKRMDLLKAIPSGFEAELRLTTARKYRADVEDLIEEVTGRKYLKWEK